jgi:hypothetical protein
MTWLTFLPFNLKPCLSKSSANGVGFDNPGKLASVSSLPLLPPIYDDRILTPSVKEFELIHSGFEPKVVMGEPANHPG